MSDKKNKIFYGIGLSEEEVDERLGIMDELLDLYPEDEAEELYEGAHENCEMIFGEYFFYDQRDELYYLGRFIDLDNDVEAQKRKIFVEFSMSIKLLEDELNELSIIID